MTRKIALVFGAAALVASAGVAFADTTTSTTPTATTAPTTVATPATPSTVLTIGAQGNVLLRGTIVSVSSNSLTVKSWGGNWTVNVPSTASVYPQGAALSSFQQGDFVGVQGTVDSALGWTVDATLVRDWTARQAMQQQQQANIQAVHQAMGAAPRVVQGTLSNLNAAAETFTLTANNTAYSVSLVSGVKLLANNWTTLDFTKVQNGDTVRVFGTVSGSTISASIFRDVSVK